MRLDHAPCSSCPYRLDHPSGVWSAEEYLKLEGYAEHPDGELPETSVFLCHHSRLGFSENAACRGWATVEQDSIAVRLAMMRRHLDPDEVRADPPVDLHESGQLAAAAGLQDISRPGPRARAMIEQIRRQANRAGVEI